MLPFLLLLCLLVATSHATPGISLLSNTFLDSSGIYFVSYDGLVNVNSFQLSGLLTYKGYQYAGWYTSNKSVILGRRTTSGGSWQTLVLPHTLTTTDSHNVIALGISPEDGVIHIAMDCHSSPVYYAKSSSGVAGSSVSWTASLFGTITNTIGSLNVGSTVTYPQFVVTPDNLLQFVYRSGVSGNGNTQLAEYKNGTWSNVGLWASGSGTYTADNGGKSTARNLYIHGVTYRGNRLYITGTWRENSGSVSCSSGGLTNHDTTFFYSDDKGRTWYNAAGTHVGTSGSSPVSVSSSGIVIDSLDANHGLMNQESQDVDSKGLIHVIISYVPGRFTQCVTNYESDRIAHGYPFHVYQAANGTFVKNEIPFALGAVGRSQIAIDASDNVYVVLPYVRVVVASKASGWSDWRMVYDGSGQGLDAFGEVTIDRGALVSSGRGTLAVLYQESSSGTTPSPVRVVQFEMYG
ncbi:hypothetical protein DFS33DRAFT_1359131 [Desarmillaria ectypa]|nr:hypothetical protein DFS33DRAFT_1359131 [Desarmillaria ectypa]